MKSIEKIIEEQIQKWQASKSSQKEEIKKKSVITISREPGSGGKIVAKALAEELGYDLFHQEVIQEMAQSAHVNKQILETLDEKGLNVLEDWINSLVFDRHLWPDQYLSHLMKVIGAIAGHGSAVIVGRGANFVIPSENRVSVRVIAPMEFRVKNVATDYKASQDEARRRIIRSESDRRSFVRKYFNTNVTDPIHYDLIINTGTISIAKAVSAIKQVI